MKNTDRQYSFYHKYTGFCLIELLVGLIVVLIAISACWRLVGASFVYMHKARVLQQELCAANTQMDKLLFGRALSAPANTQRVFVTYQSTQKEIDGVRVRRMEVVVASHENSVPPVKLVSIGEP